MNKAGRHPTPQGDREGKWEGEMGLSETGFKCLGLYVRFCRGFVWGFGAL